MKKIKLLIIEDEAAIRDMVIFAFSGKSFDISEAEDAPSAISSLNNKLPDIILLDWMLPGTSGIDFIKKLKADKLTQDIPIIMLTAKAEEKNKVQGLMSGADDYVTKPFSPSELEARIHSVLRRGIVKSPDDEIHCGDLVLNTAKHEAILSGDAIDLSKTDYDMLHFFVTHPGKTYSRDQLITAIWGATTYIDERSVDVQIRRLRDKLRPGNHDKLIKTIRGAGYQFDKP